MKSYVVDTKEYGVVRVGGNARAESVEGETRNGPTSLAVNLPELRLFSRRTSFQEEEGKGGFWGEGEEL